MDLRLSDEETQIREAARTFARREIQPIADRMDREDYFPRDTFAKLGAEGFLGITLPERWGGLGLSYIAQALVLEEIARVSPALALSVGAHSNLMADNLARNGTDAQRDRYLPSLASGKTIGALALTEPNAGSDALSLATTARKEGDVYRLNGSKQFITNGPVADVLLVYAKTDPKAGARGISAFLVTKDSPGFTVSLPLDKMGMRGSPTGELSFQDVRIPADHLVGRENEGVAIVMSGLNIERAVLAGIPLGIMEECLARATSYAREREQFGQKIGRFELVAAKLANMWTDLEAARYLVYSALVSVQSNTRSARASSAALTFASEASTRHALEAIQILGGYGYMRDTPLERLARDAKLLEIGAGTSEIRRLVIARELLGPGFS